MRIKHIIGVFICIIGIACAIFLSWYRSEVNPNNGIAFVMSMMAFLSASGLVKIIADIIKEKKNKRIENKE